MGKIKVGAFGAFRGIVLMQSMVVMPEVELVAILDKSHAALNMAQKMADHLGIKIKMYTEYADFFRHDMDAVILANYATEHAPYAIEFLRSGRHVMSEVPPCETMAQCVELVEAVKESGLVYSMAENYCYMDDTFEMRRRYDLGDIGDISYAEGAYIHDQSRQHPLKSAGDPNHWRNTIYSTYYSTHALFPPMFISGHLPVKVSGFETPSMGLVPRNMGYRGGGAGLIIATLDNGALLRGIVGGFKREPFEHNLNYTIYGTKGTMETHSIHDHNISVYREGDSLCRGTSEDYYPKRFIAVDEAQTFLDEASKQTEIFSEGTIGTQFHRCGDFYPGYFFIQKILGRESGKYIVDEYQATAVNMCGILAYRSILNGGKSIDIPDLHIAAERDRYRNDRACTTPSVAGDQLIPSNPAGEPDIDPEVYKYVHSLWEKGQSAEHGYIPENGGEN